ncbi:MAG: hypothetical protein E7213_07090 [Clostridium sp.]|nr:hypothetical protein [Clostridium sp.]
MKDKNGNPVGVLAHLTKTHVTNSNDDVMVSTLNKDLNDIKVNDQLSNEDIISYTNPSTETNKQNILADSIDASTNKEKFKTSITSDNPEGEINLSSMSNTSNTGFMN